MRIQDLSEKFADGFKKGYGKPVLGNHPAEKKAAPIQSAAPVSPFSMLSNKEAKDILYNVINGTKLDYSQINKLEQIYKKL